MWVLFAILQVNNSFSYRIFRSILVLVIISQFTLVSKLFCRTASHRRWRRSDWGECSDSVEDFRLIMAWSYLASDSHHAKRIMEFICWMLSLWINQSRKTSRGGKFINSFELCSLHGYTTLHYYSSIIADLLERRMTGISFLWRLLLNIMKTIPACAPIQGSTISQIHAYHILRCPLAAAYAQQRWLPCSGTACYNFQHAAPPGCSPVNP